MTIDRLHVLWIDESRRGRHPVGVLSRESGTYFFEYGDLTEARALGFTVLLEFRDVEVRYSSSRLFTTFAERVPAPKRRDRQRIVESLGVRDPTDDFELLARSGGSLATDRLELAEHRPVGDRFERPLVFRVAGTRHYPQAVPLEPRERLQVRRHRDNEYDSFACELVRAGDVRAGFVPRAYSEAVAAALDTGSDLRATLLKAVLLPEQPSPTWIAQIEADKGS